MIEQTSDSRPRPQLEERGTLLAEHVGSVLAHARRQDRILFLRMWQTLGHGLEWFHGRKLAKTLAILGTAAAVVAALCLVPWEYRVVGKGKLMPIRRRAIFAPENGEVIRINVHDREKVHKGQLLLLLRNEQLQAELNENESKLLQALQQATSFTGEEEAANRDGDKKAALQAASGRSKSRLEAEGLTRILKIQRERVESLKVTSPIEGTVAAFQLEQLLQNRPVQQGELLLEVMDETGPWRLELEVEGSRMGHVLAPGTAAPIKSCPLISSPPPPQNPPFMGSSTGSRTGPSRPTRPTSSSALSRPMPAKSPICESGPRCGPRSVAANAAWVTFCLAT